MKPTRMGGRFSFVERDRCLNEIWGVPTGLPVAVIVVVTVAVACWPVTREVPDLFL